MGFSLSYFFDDLLAVLGSEDSDADKLTQLTELIQRAHEYAMECGELK